MENPWFCVDEQEEEEQDGVYMGVFNRPPSEIARQLSRPLTPSFAAVPSFNFNPSKGEEIKNEVYLESPVMEGRSSSLICGHSLVSVF